MFKRLLLLLMVCVFAVDAGEVRGSIGPQFYYVDLEFDEPDSIDGYMAGIVAKVDYFCDCYRAGVEFRGGWDTNHLRGDPAQKSCVTEYFVTGRLGYWFDACGCLSTGLFTGFGWHELENCQNPDMTALCYRYDKLFIPLGISICAPLCGNGSIGLQVEWRPDVYASLDFESDSLDNCKEQGYRIEIPFSWCCETACGAFFTSVVPFYDWARFGKYSGENEIQVQFMVPSTKRWEAGLTWLIGYNF